MHGNAATTAEAMSRYEPTIEQWTSEETLFQKTRIAAKYRGPRSAASEPFERHFLPRANMGKVMTTTASQGNRQRSKDCCLAIVASFGFCHTNANGHAVCLLNGSRRRGRCSADAALALGGGRWGHSLTANCFDSAAFRSFYDANIAHGPEDICADRADLPSDSCL